MRWTVMKSLCLLVIFSLVWTSLTIPAVEAAMVGTEKVLDGSQAQEVRAQVKNLLEREEVQKALETQGIAAAEARARIDALSEAEVLRIGGRLDQLPAGGSGLGTLVGAAVLVFIVLLITDILGLTEVFPFVKHGSIPVRK